MKAELYQVRYLNAQGKARMGLVKGHTPSEAFVKAKRFVIAGGQVVSVVNTHA